MAGYACPCCGHLSLPRGPGDYELCPVCFWEDDGGQLRYPMSADGANGISLMEAQQAYLRYGACDKGSRRKVRSARVDEPLDEGWRPFAPAIDWTDPALDSDRWPANGEALYYWRPTYWNGDQHRLPPEDRVPTNQDRFLDHLRRVPELEEPIAESERRWGVASAWDVCKQVGVVVLEAYRAGDEQRALRIVNALLPALDEGSDTYAPNCVCIGFLEHQGWRDPSIRAYLDRWPSPLREEVQEQLAYQDEYEANQQRWHEEWAELRSWAKGNSVGAVVERLRAREELEHSEPITFEPVARVLVDGRWLYRHPVDSLRLAWRYRDQRSPWRTLTWLRRPRFAG